jgi:Yip1 domain
MSETAAAPREAAAPNVFARFLGIITEPKNTFERVVASPKWLGMLVLTTVIVAFFTALPMTTEAGRQATVDQQVASMKSFGIDVSDELYDRLEQGAGRAPYTTAFFIVIVSPIMALIISGLLFAVFNAALGGEASFKQLYAVIVHAGAISALSAVFSGVINYFRGAVGSVANLGALLPMLPEHSFIANLFSTIDIFLVWWVIVLAIGLAVLYRRRTQPIAVGLFAVYAVVALAITAFKTLRGGA